MEPTGDALDMLDPAYDARVASTEAAMREAGAPTEDIVEVDYFAFDVTHTVHLPDGKQYVEHRELNEGQRKKYLNGMNRDMLVNRASGDMRVKMAPGDERHALLETAITGWNLQRGGNPLPFSPKELKNFLEVAPPRIIDIIEKDVRKHNPWLLQEMSVEDIDKEIASLEEMREVKLKEEAGNDSSSNK
jgi:hypothetical protein